MTPDRDVPGEIQVPPIDPEKVAAILDQKNEEVQAELKKLEEAKKVSQKTMQKVIGPCSWNRRAGDG